jgi:hypothetical protein
MEKGRGEIPEESPEKVNSAIGMWGEWFPANDPESDFSQSD